MDQRRLTAGPTERDIALWFTERIVETLRARRFDELQPVASPFAPALGAGEVMLAEGPFELSTFRAVGDGSYVQRSAAVLPIGRGGLGLAAGALVAQAVANRRRQAAATAAATPRWVIDDGGTLWVATHGFYLQTVRGLYPWPWQSIASAELVGAGQVRLQGTSDGGQISWIIGSKWAELLFAVWAWSGTPATHSSLLAHGRLASRQQLRPCARERFGLQQASVLSPATHASRDRLRSAVRSDASPRCCQAAFAARSLAKYSSAHRS